MKKENFLFALLLIVILNLSLVSSLDFDNVKTFEKTTDYPLGTVKIKNFFGLGSDIATLNLANNTFDCVSSCFAIKDIYLNKEGSLIDDVRFYRLTDQGFVLSSIRNYKFLIQVGDEWVDYDIGSDRPEGYYRIKLEGEKKPGAIYDWQIKSQGLWITEWSIWGTPLNVNETHGIAMGTNSGPSAFARGNKIFIKSPTLNATIVTITKDSNDDGTTCVVWTSVSGGQVCSASWSGNTCTLSNCVVKNATNYYLGSEGGTNGRASAGGQVGISATLINWTGISWSADGGGSEFANQYRSIVSVNISSLPSQIIQNYPLNNTVFNNQSLFFNATAIIDGGAQLTNISLFHNETGTFHLNATNVVTGITNNTIFNLNISSNLTTFIWNVYACDTDGDCGFANNLTVEVDTMPPIINITYPIGIVPYHRSGNNLTLNWTFDASDVDSCWFNYNAINISVSCVANSTSFNVTSFNVKNLTFFINDSFGITGQDDTKWDYSIFENSVSFNSNVLEGSTQLLSINISYNDSIYSTVNGNLFYNNTIFSSSSTGSTHNLIFSNSIEIPTVSTNTMKDFFWNFTLSNSSATVRINTTENTQDIFILSIDTCGANTLRLMNLTVVDEELQTFIINATIEAAISIKTLTGSEILNISDSYTNPVSFCINNQTFFQSTYKLDSNIKYFGDGYATEYYTILNQTLNSSSNFNGNITLYDLNLSDSTEFLLTFSGENFLPEPSVLVYVEREYIPEDTFKTVELPLTDSNGQTVLHLVRNDVNYNLIMVKDGEIIGFFQNIRAFCQDIVIGDCQIVLSASSSQENNFIYDDILGIAFTGSPTYNNQTNTISFSFVSTTGSSLTVDLNVTRSDVFGNNTICSNSLTSSSGTVACTLTTETDTTLIAGVSVNGATIIISNIDIDESDFGPLGFGLWFILSIVLVLIMGDTKNGVLISLSISYIGAIALGISRGTILGLGATGIWILTVTSLAIWRINKGRPQ